MPKQRSEQPYVQESNLANKTCGKPTRSISIDSNPDDFDLITYVLDDKKHPNNNFTQNLQRKSIIHFQPASSTNTYKIDQATQTTSRLSQKKLTSSDSGQPSRKRLNNHSLLSQKLLNTKTTNNNQQDQEYNNNQQDQEDIKAKYTKYLQEKVKSKPTCEKNIAPCNLTFEDLLYSDEVKNYLPKDIKNNLVDFTEENKQFKQNQLLNKTVEMIYLNLDDRQKNILSFFDTAYFPQTFNSAKRNLIKRQIMQNNRFFMSGTIQPLQYIPVFIPLHLYIDSNNYLDEKFCQAQLDYTKKLKINYITATTLNANREAVKSDEKSTQNTQYLLTSINKIDEKTVPEIFAFIPDECIDENMQMTRSFKDFNIRCIIFHKFFKYDDQLGYGCYKIVANKKINLLCLQGSNCNKQQLSNEQIKQLDVVTELQDLEARINLCINTVQKINYGRASRARKMLHEDKILKQKVECWKKAYDFLKDDDSLFQNSLSTAKFNIQKNIQDLNTTVYLDSRIFNNNKLAANFFNKIKSKMHEKYLQEKKENISDLDSLLNVLDTSAFAEKLYGDLFMFIQNDLYKKIQAINQNRELLEPVKIVILLPYKYYNCVSEQDITDGAVCIEDLIEADISKHFYVKMYATDRNYIGQNRAIVGLTNDLPVNNALTDDKIIVLLPPSFDICGMPLFNPHQFLLTAFFYRNVIKYNANYSLYEFDIDKEINLLGKDTDVSREFYIATSKQNIEKVSLKEYVIQCYETLDERVKNKAISIIGKIKAQKTKQIKAKQKQKK